MTDRVYCHGDLVTTRIVDDWYVCGGCGHDLWPIDATFAVDPQGDKDGYGYQDEGQEDDREKARPLSGGAEEAGRF